MHKRLTKTNKSSLRCPFTLNKNEFYPFKWGVGEQLQRIVKATKSTFTLTWIPLKPGIDEEVYLVLAG